MRHASTDALTPERWRRAQAAFHDAVDRGPAARAAALDVACADDPALRRVVEEMIAADDTGASAPFEALPEALGMLRLRREFDEAQPPDPTACAGRQIGVYCLQRELGRGGMGTVYLAERTDVARLVALKLVRGGLAAPERVARFRVEQRLLAGLDHPHIARLLDAGVADDGTPFFAMEYVDGEPIDRYCDRHRLPVATRLALVEQACEAVAFAHRNLVVHRDLKPSNLLVTAAGEAKLLDFGIAKLLAPDTPSDVTPLTAAGVRWMTPEYAAPEQADGAPVTTAADVYALGVVAYELLVGARPARGVARDRLPPRPSSAARTGGGGDTAPPGGIAAARGTTPPQLARQLGGDLDAIVLKALDPDPARRYASAAELLDDLRRHRGGFPVRARPDSQTYRARLFVRRNRWSVAAAAGAVALLAATAGALAVAQARTAAALARATDEATKAREVTRFITTLFQDADPFRVGAATSARPGTGPDLANLGSERLTRELAGQPAARVELLHTLAVVQRNRGRYEQADSLLLRALDTRRSIRSARGSGALDAADADVAGLLYDLGIVRRLRNDFAGADTLLTQALAMRLALPGVTRADLAATRAELGTLRRYQGRYAEAKTLLVQAVAAERQSPGPALAEALERLALLDYVAGDVLQGIALIREAIPIRERWLGRDHPAVARSYSLLASLLTGVLGATAPADSAARRALELQRRWLPAGHPDVLTTESTLSLILLNEGASARAEQLQRAVLAGRQRLFGRTHRDVAGSMAVLGHMRRRRGDLAGALALLRQSAAIYARVSGPDHADVQGVWKEMAQVEVTRGDERAALALARRLLAARHASLWDPVAQPLAELASVVADGGIVTEDDPGACRRAAPLARRALAAYRARHPDAPPDDVHVIEIARGLGRRC